MKKVLKTLLKVVLFTAGLLLLVFLIAYLSYNQPLPKGNSQAEADMLANKMLTAINHNAYKDTRYLEWSFRNGAHRYKWDKSMGLVDVYWNDYTVYLNLDVPADSEVLDGNSELIGPKKEKLIAKATSLFNNDSFWLVAPFKVFDKGTTRSIVTLDDGSRGLMVTYAQGGDTPGDTYLWKLGDNGFPESYQMWVQLIPIGGIEASWDNWQVMESGAFLPKSHELGPITMDMGTIKAYN